VPVAESHGIGGFTGAQICGESFGVREHLLPQWHIHNYKTHLFVVCVLDLHVDLAAIAAVGVRETYAGPHFVSVAPGSGLHVANGCFDTESAKLLLGHVRGKMKKFTLLLTLQSEAAARHVRP
jgi:hypothetical protein